MAEPLSFINPKTQSFEALKRDLQLTGICARKFDALNSHIANTVVIAGELVIIGDPSTPASTSQEAYLMGKANEIHLSLLSNQVDGDDFLLDNFDLLQGVLSNGALGAGVISDAWSRHMAEIKKSLEAIEKLHQQYLRTGSITARDKFYTERAILFARLEGQLDNVASYGAGLQKQGSVKRMLGISTKSYLNSGEIRGYAEKISGVARAAKYIKKGVYIGTALDVAATALEIKKACSLGREDQCTRAKYVEGATLVLGLGGSTVGGIAGGHAATVGCSVVLGLTTGPGVLVCAVVGGVVGGAVGGAIGGKYGGKMGEILYGKITQ
ncbi:hypothetical protein [Pseudomonas sp. UM16]|uniref:hypothetical protein n=1 Tax=Pseudomonas sp. UM16 TaxID=3158962 RepID=UPI00398FD652